MAYRKAFVYVCDQYAGLLEETDAGYSFAYEKKYLASEKPLPVSLTLPLQEQPYESQTLFAFFDGLIPEGWLLDIVSHNWKIDQNDRFGLLLAACRDCIGNVSIRGDAL
ncbi:MAG: HipA N-terminal domain-containing protein [Anaerolineaceae bacterium]|nr:HipA N-terminal domain-containing protein [Anaerolineaceae bacterium]